MDHIIKYHACSIWILKQFMYNIYHKTYPLELIYYIAYLIKKLTKIRITSGFRHTIITIDNVAYGLGSNTSNQLSLSAPTAHFTRLSVPHFEEIICASSGTFIIGAENYAIGNNLQGQLGIGHKIKPTEWTKFHFPAPIKKITGGISFTLFLTTDGNLYS